MHGITYESELQPPKNLMQLITWKLDLSEPYFIYTYLPLLYPQLAAILLPGKSGYYKFQHSFSSGPASLHLGGLKVPAFPLYVLIRTCYTNWVDCKAQPSLCSHQVIPHYNWGDNKAQHPFILAWSCHTTTGETTNPSIPPSVSSSGPATL